MKKKNMLTPQRGFSLVEIMVVAGLMGGLALGIMKMIDMMRKGQKKTTQDFIMHQVMKEANTYLTREKNCSKSLENININDSNNTFSIQRYVVATDTFVDRFTVGYKEGNKVEITSISARKIPSAPIGDDERGQFEVRIGMRRLGQKPTTAVMSVKLIGKLLGGVIQNCISYETNAIEEGIRKVCKGLGGVIDPVSGNCTPTVVNVAALGTCTAAETGLTRYNSQIKKQELCDGTNWTFGEGNKIPVYDIGGSLVTDDFFKFIYNNSLATVVETTNYLSVSINCPLIHSCEHPLVRSNCGWITSYPDNKCNYLNGVDRGNSTAAVRSMFPTATNISTVRTWRNYDWGCGGADKYYCKSTFRIPRVVRGYIIVD